MNKKFIFVSGIPRAGSTILCNVLSQNPRIHASATSALLEVLFVIRNQWDEWIEHKAMPPELCEQRKLQVLRATMDAYYQDVEEPIVVDKSRGWLAHLEMAEAILGHKAKVLVPVRDIRDVLASFEMIWRKNGATRQMAQEKEQYFRMQTTGGRCQVWMQENQPVGLAYNRVRDAVQRGFKDRMFPVPYEQLTNDPAGMLNVIYGFLEEETFEHDFDNVKQVTAEDDLVHGLPGLHAIRAKIEPQSPRWPSVLGYEVASQYAAMNLFGRT